MKLPNYTFSFCSAVYCPFFSKFWLKFFLSLAGLPKPVIITQAKAIGISKFFTLFEFKPTDILYTVTPLYHSAAGGLGLMNTLDQGE